MANINTSIRQAPVQGINQVVSDSNNGKCANPLVGNLEQVKNSATGFSQQSSRSKPSCFFVKLVKFIKGKLSKSLTSQGSKSGKATYGRAAPETKKETKAAPVLNAEVVGKTNTSSVPPKMNERGIPSPPPPPPPQQPSRALSCPSVLPNRSGSKSVSSSNKGAQANSLQQALHAELSDVLAKRRGKENITYESTASTQKPWVMEIAEQRKAYALAAPEREASEAKEEARVALALAEAKAVKEVKQNAIEAEKVNRSPVIFKMDEKGIPLPPPPPPPPLSRSQSYPSALSNRSVDKSDSKGAQANSLQKALYAELSGVLAKRRGKENIMDDGCE